MTKIKLCGLTRAKDIQAANRLVPEYIGFVFAEKSRRYVTGEQAKNLRAMLIPEIKAAGVFVREYPALVAELANSGTIDIVQLHGGESEDYIKALRGMTDKKIIKAFSVTCERDVEEAEKSSADYVLLDSGTGGTGTNFDWSLLKGINRQYFLAGGLDSERVKQALKILSPYCVDVSSGIETNGTKDEKKMRDFVSAVRNFWDAE